MKIPKTIWIAGSISMLAASPAAFADGGKGAEPAVTEPEVAICEKPGVDVSGEEVEIIEIEDGQIEDGGVIDGKDDGVTEGEEGEVGITVEPVENLEDGNGVEGETGSEGPSAEVDPAETGEPVPVDWVKRGGGEMENPDVIFMTTALDGGGIQVPAFKGNHREFGQDDRATAIEAKSAAGAPEVNKEKKGPVALIKKGRVFLR